MVDLGVCAARPAEADAQAVVAILPRGGKCMRCRWKLIDDLERKCLRTSRFLNEAVLLGNNEKRMGLGPFFFFLCLML